MWLVQGAGLKVVSSHMRLAVSLMGAVAATAGAAGMAHGQEAPVSTAPPAGDAEVAERRIDVMNFRIDGNTVLPRIEVERAVYPFLGPQRTVGDVENARAALEAAYRAAGYETVGVEIPEQDVRGGVVRLTVMELRVGRLRVTDSRYFSPDGIRARAPSLAEGVVPNYQQVATEVAALNRSADRTITPTLRAGETPGTVDVDLQVEDRLPVHGSLEINDRFSNRTERIRLAASINYSNLFQREHSLSLQVQTTPDEVSESLVFSGSYVAPIASTPFTVVGYAVHSDSDVAAIGGIGVIGSGDIIGARLIAATQKGAAVHQLIAGLDYKSFNEDLILGSDTASTPIDYIPLTFQYALAYRGVSDDVDLNLGLNFGIRGLDADDHEYRLKRFNAESGWAYARGDLSWRRRMAADTAMIFRLGAQLSGQPLISNEQFAAGGLDSVRGYYESQELGDYGVYWQYELESPSVHRWLGGDDFRFFTFVDGAYLGVYDALPDLSGRVEDRFRLASAGLGLRVRLLDRINASALLAGPLIDREDTKTDFDGRWRGQFRVWSDF